MTMTETSPKFHADTVRVAHHIYIVGRGWNAEVNEPTGLRRLHAVYDAGAKNILWMRWNLSSRGTITDIDPNTGP